MGEVVVKVNGRDFALLCAEGQEARLRQLAQFVDARVGEFSKRLGQAGEARLILLAALAIADELSDANDALQEERERAPGQVSAVPDTAAEDAAKATASSLDDLAQRIESIAARMETP
jgi:cell division protein ZapA